MIDSSGGSRGEVLRRIGIARSCMNLLEKKNLEVKHQAGYQNTPLPDIHSPCLVVWVQNMVHNKALVLSHWCIWHVGTTKDSEDTIYIYAMWRTWKSEQPPDAVLSPTWSLTDVCGFLDILPAAHHKRSTTLLSLRWSGTASRLQATVRKPSHTWIRAVEADLGQQNIAIAAGGRQLFVMIGGALWTQLRSSGVCYKRKRKKKLVTRATLCIARSLLS